MKLLIPLGVELTSFRVGQSNDRPRHSTDRYCQTKFWVLAGPSNKSSQTRPRQVHSVQASKAPGQQCEPDLQAYDPELPMRQNTGQKACGE